MRQSSAPDSGPERRIALIKPSAAELTTQLRVVAALASCALIETAQPAPTAPKVTRAESSVPTPVGGLKQFPRNLRKHLRLRGTS